MAKRKSPLKETGKFVLRMAVFALPLLVTYLTDSGLVEEAAVLSAFLAVLDKYIHTNPEIKSSGLTPF